MKPVSIEEYKKMQEKDWAWANAIIKAQHDDERPYVVYLKNRPIINLKQMMESTVELYGDRASYYTKFEKGPYKKITHKEAFDDVNALGTALINLGFKDERIAVIGETQYMWSTAYLAVVCGTGVVVPLDKELPYNDLKNLINEAEVTCVIYDKKREETFVKMFEEGETGLRHIIAQERHENIKKGDVLDEKTGLKADFDILSQWELIREGKELLKNGDRRFLDAQIDSQEMAVIIFTSGTTGMAKGIMLSHRNLCADLMVAPSISKFNETDVFYSILPIHHTFECTCVFLMHLYKGAAIAHSEGLKYIVKNIQEIHPTFILAVPAILEALYKSIWKGIKAKGKENTVRKLMKVCDAFKKIGIDLTGIFFKEIKETLGGSIRMMICGGAAINPQILDDFSSLGIPAIQGYGLSEASPMGALNPDVKPKSNSIGVAFPSFDAKISEPGADGIGEICLKGDNIMLGYYKKPEETAKVIKDGWFHTGDLGYMDDDGYIYLTGRMKNVIITKNGKNVFPEEIEYLLSNFNIIKESMVFQDDSENKDDTVIVAAIYPEWEEIKSILGDKASDDEEVVKYLWTLVDQVNANNPGYKMIKKIVLRHTEFEKNTSKKIRRFVEDNKKAI